MANTEFVLTELQNSTERPYTILLEPWANEYPLAPGAHVKVVAEATGPVSGSPTIEIRPNYIVIWPPHGILELSGLEKETD